MASKRRTRRDVLAMDRGTLRLLADACYEVASTFLFLPIRKKETELVRKDNGSVDKKESK